jgi:DNA-binding GntR family transcriptional regulator
MAGRIMEAANKNNSYTKAILNNEKNLTHMVYRKIKEMMLNYEIVPGQRLIFSDLAKRMGVSRTPVNNALSILANEGFLDLIPHQGYSVHQITKDEAESLYEIREIIELGSLGKAIRALTPEKLEELEEKKRLYENAVVDQVSRGRFTLDQEFHACLVQMSNNLYLADYFREVYQRIFLRHRIEGLRADRAQKVVSEHNEIFEAVSLRDIEWAKESIKSHIKAGKDYIFSIIFC